MTLPLIHALRQAPEKERKAMIHIVKNKNNDKKAVNQLIERVKQLGGLDFAVVQMKQYQEKALAILAQYPQSEYKNSLELMVNYVIDRKH